MDRRDFLARTSLGLAAALAPAPARAAPSAPASVQTTFRRDLVVALAFAGPAPIPTRRPLPEGALARPWPGADPGPPHDYWRHDEFDRLACIARPSGDARTRAETCRTMIAILLDEARWIMAPQPVEACGLRRCVELTPSPDQRFELRRSDLGMRHP